MTRHRGPSENYVFVARQTVVANFNFSLTTSTKEKAPTKPTVEKISTIGADRAIQF
jgi:hypothetical protein